MYVKATDVSHTLRATPCATVDDKGFNFQASLASMCEGRRVDFRAQESQIKQVLDKIAEGGKKMWGFTPQGINFKSEKFGNTAREAKWYVAKIINL